MTQVHKRLEEAQAKLSGRTTAESQAQALLANAKYNLIVRPSRTAAHIRDRAVADPTRSRAYPAPEGW